MHKLYVYKYEMQLKTVYFLCMMRWLQLIFCTVYWENNDKTQSDKYITDENDADCILYYRTTRPLYPDEMASTIQSHLARICSICYYVPYISQTNH